MRCQVQDYLYKSSAEMRNDMGFINELVTYAIVAVGIGALAVGGIFFGKFLRTKYDAREKKAE